MVWMLESVCVFNAFSTPRMETLLNARRSNMEQEEWGALGVCVALAALCPYTGWLSLVRHDARTGLM